MTRAALTKLIILVILAFIICLPEFFTLYREFKVNFLCLPYRPCELENQVNTRKGNGNTGSAEIREKDMCNPAQNPEREKWEQSCTQGNQSNTTDPEKSWFMCETDTDMAELHNSTSSSDLKVHLKMLVELQFRDAETLNLTLYGHRNLSSLHLRPPEEEVDEVKKEEDEGQMKAFYCCLPAPPSNQSRCLLWLSNQTVVTAGAKEKLPWKRTPKDEWWCVFRVLWLALLCVVMLAIITTVLGKVYWGRCMCKNLNRNRNLTGEQLNDGEKHAKVNIPNGTVPHSYGLQPWSELSTIHEDDSQEVDVETLLDGNVDNCYTANLHHRSHPSISSITEEPAR